MGFLGSIPRAPIIQIDPDTIRIDDLLDVDLSHYFDITIDDVNHYVLFNPKIGDLRIQDPDDIDNSDYIQFTTDDALGGIIQLSSRITDGYIWNIDHNGTISGATATVDINEINIDLGGITIDDGAANAVSLIPIYINASVITATAVGLSSFEGIWVVCPTTGEYNIETGIHIDANKGDADNDAIGLNVGRDLNAAITANRAYGGDSYTARITQAGNNSSAGDFDLDQPINSGCLFLGLQHNAITTVGAKTDPDTFAATALNIDIDGTTNNANTKLDANPRAIDIEYTLTETLGELRMAATDIIRVSATIPNGLSSAGAFQFDMFEINADGVVLNDANITFRGINIDASALTNTSSADATILEILAPATIDAAILVNLDGIIASSGATLVTTRDIDGTVAGIVALTNYSNILGQAVVHSGGDFIVTQTAATAGIMNLVMAHTVDGFNTTAPDVFASTALNIDIDATVSGDAGADLDVSARAIDIAYNLTETLGVLRMAATDIARITAAIPDGLTSAGAFQFDIFEINADAVTLNDANITFNGLNIDASGMTLTVGAAVYGANITMPTSAGLPFERAALKTSDGVNITHLSNGSMGVSALGISEEKYYKCEDFDEEAVAVTLGGGLRADEWTVGGTGATADDITYIAGAGGIIELETDGADNDSVGAYWIGTNILVNSNPILEFRFRVDGVGANDVSCLLGLTETVNILDINNIAAVSDDICCVGMNSDLANFANVRLWTNDTGGAETVSDLGVALTANVWCTVRIDCTDTEQIRVWINNTGGAISSDDEIAVATVGAGTIQGGIAMFPFIFVQSLDAGPSTTALEVDYIKIWQDRS